MNNTYRRFIKRRVRWRPANRGAYPLQAYQYNYRPKPVYYGPKNTNKHLQKEYYDDYRTRKVHVRGNV